MALIFLSILWIVDVCQPCCFRLIMYMRTINRDVHTYTWFTDFKSLYANRLMVIFRLDWLVYHNSYKFSGFFYLSVKYSILYHLKSIFIIFTEVNISFQRPHVFILRSSTHTKHRTHTCIWLKLGNIFHRQPEHIVSCVKYQSTYCRMLFPAWSNSWMYVILVYYWVMDHDSTWPDKNIRSTCTLDHGLFPIIQCNQATKTYRHQLVYQSPWPKCQLKDMYIKMMKKTVKSLNTIDSKSFE